MNNDKFMEWVDDEGGLESLCIGHGIDTSEIDDLYLRLAVEEYISTYRKVLEPIINKIYRLCNG